MFDRFLARLDLELGPAITLKGGLALEIRIERARTTKDVDLRVMGSPEGILDRLRAAGRRDLGDFLLFTVRPDDRHPEILNEGLKYEGIRFRTECTLAGKVYGRPFGVDVAFGDPVFREPDVIGAPDTLSFAGIPPPSLRVYPVETHIAEKLHAYTLPRSRINTRVKDLPDLALLASAKSVAALELRAAIVQTFGFRGTHDVPGRLPEPPESWTAPYEVTARTDQLPWRTLAEVHTAAASFLNPVLGEPIEVVWTPDTWTWSRARSEGE